MKPLVIIFVLIWTISTNAQSQSNLVTNIALQTNSSPAASATNFTPQPQATSNATVAGGLSTPTNNAPATDWSKWFAVIVSILALSYTVWKDIKTNKRMEKIEKEQEREKQEAANRRAKASAPYFTPAGKMFNMLYEEDDDGELGVWTWANGNVLSGSRKEMPKDSPEKTPVIIPLNNSGKGARRIRLSGDIPDVELKQEPDIPDANRTIFLKYPYSPAQHGKTQKITLTFETEDGFDLTHTYETRHGFFEFRRINPA